MRRRRRGGGGNDPLLGTTAHALYGRGRVGHRHQCPHPQERGCLGEIPNNSKLYEAQRNLIFATAEEAEAHPQKVRKGKTPTTNPPRPERSPLTPRLTPKKTLNPTKIPPLTHLTPQPQPKVPRHYETRNRAPERCNT